MAAPLINTTCTTRREHCPFLQMTRILWYEHSCLRSLVHHGDICRLGLPRALPSQVLASRLAGPSWRQKRSERLPVPVSSCAHSLFQAPVFTASPNNPSAKD